MQYGVVMHRQEDGPNVWINVGTLVAPAKSKIATAERRLLEQGPDVPKLPLEAGEIADVQLVRLDAMTEAVRVQAKPTVLIEVVPAESEAPVTGHAS